MSAHMTGAVIALLLTAGGTAAATDPATYDEGLCERAQRQLLNAGEGEVPFALRVLRGEGNGFHTIQMDVDAASRTVVVAASTSHSGALATHVACKMVDRERVNDVLGLALPGPARSCREVNEATYRDALATLAAGERRRYEAAGRPLRFLDDYLAATGGEWLPVAVDGFIRPAADGALEISAPSVRVPWRSAERNFFQGTQHCKLITLAAMRSWMLGGALAGERQLFPPAKAACSAPSAPTSRVGSCLFYFAPAGGRFCEDYTGSGWTGQSARAACGKRHASAEALAAAANRYEGAGGLFSAEGCATRPDAAALGGACVFHCNAPDEALWRVMDAAAAGGAAAGMMARACDLYVP